jgi:hypothetical protein
MTNYIYIDSSNRILLTGLYDNESAAYNNTATITINFYDMDATLVAGPISFSYIASSDGNYSAILPYSTTLTDGTEYEAIGVIDAGAAGQHKFKMFVRAVYDVE